MASNSSAIDKDHEDREKRDCHNMNDMQSKNAANPENCCPLNNSVQCTGYFNYINVEIRSLNEMTLLYHMGYFGKSSISRSKPDLLVNDGGHSIMRKRQFSRRVSIYKKFDVPKHCTESKVFFEDVQRLTRLIRRAKNKNVIDLVSSDEDANEHDYEEMNITDDGTHFYDVNNDDIVIVVPNSDSEGDNYFENFSPKCCVSKIKLEESLILSFQEAFYLSYELGCLQIMGDNKLLDTDLCWKLFNESDKKFVPKYVIYHYFRSKNYIVKPGIKFGSDYLLYKDGPGLSHASHMVVIKYEGQTDQDWISILGHVRMAATTVKEILIAEVIKSDMEVVDGPKELENYSVRETLITRKLPITIKDESE